MRARATTLPSSPAAIAFTDDVPISIPTVTFDWAMLSALDTRLSEGRRRRLRERREHRVVQLAVRAHEAAAVHVAPTVNGGPARAGFLDNRHDCRDVPEVDDRIDRDVQRPVGHEHVLPEVADAAQPPTPVRQGDHL